MVLIITLSTDYYFHIASWLIVRISVYLPFSVIGFSDLNLNWSFTLWHILCEFIVCFILVSRRCSFLGLIDLVCLLPSVYLFFCVVIELEKSVFIKALHLGFSVSMSFIVWTLFSCGSLCHYFHLLLEMLLQWGWAKHWYMKVPLGVIL